MNKITIKFHGNLTQFGESFTLYAETVNEAIHSLAIQIDGLKKYLRKGYYRVKVDSKTVSQSEYINVVGVQADSVIHVSPRIAGSGKWGGFIAGAVLIGLSFIPGLGALMFVGVGLMIGGVTQLLTKQPAFNDDNSGIEDNKSSAFTRLKNITGQGRQIPRIYGNLRVGSVIVSQELSSYRTDGTTKIDSVQKPEYIKNRIALIPVTDPDGQTYNLDLNADSVKESATTIVTKWS